MSEQPALDGMPDPLYPAAPARLTTYSDCPRRYRWAYLERPAPARSAWGHTSVGAAVHTALARWWDLPRDRRTPEAGGSLVVGAWPESTASGFRDLGQSRAARERARAQVVRYLDGVDPDERPLAVERTVSVTTTHASLWGRLDRLDDRPGTGLVVVDYKTGRSEPTAGDARDSLALAVYAAAAARTLRRPCTRVELHHLPSGRTAGWDHTEHSLAAHLERADVLVAEIADREATYAGGVGVEEADALFPARVGPQCGWCDFRAVCAPGRAVPRRQPWDGLAAG